MRSLLETGVFHAPEYSPYYLLYGLVMQLTTDYVLGMRLALCITSLCLSLGCVALLYKRLDGFRLMIMALFFCYSPALFHLSIQYAKQALALALLCFGLSVLIRVQRRTSYVWAGLLLAAAFFSHRLVSALLLYWLGSVLVFYGGFSVRRYLNRRLLLIGLAGLSGLLLLLYLFPRGLGVADLERLSGVWEWRTPPQLSYLKHYNVGPLVLLEVFSLPALLLVVLKKQNWAGLQGLFSKPTIPGVMLLMTLPVLIVFNLPLFGFFDLQVRLLLTAIPICMAVCYYMLWDEPEIGKRVSYVAIGLMGIVVVEIYFQQSFYSSKRFEHDYKTFDVLIEKQRAYIQNRGGELMIAHAGLAAYYDYKTYGDALPWAPEKELDRSKIWRFVYGIQSREVLNRLRLKKDEQRLHELGHKYLLIREDLWERLLEYSETYYDEEFKKRLSYWKNPLKVRPAYLRK